MINEKLFEVLEEYALDAPEKFDQAYLSAMQARFPEFAEELRDYAVSEAFLSGPEPELTAEDLARAKEGSKRAIAQILARSDNKFELQSLLKMAKDRGFDRKSFAAAAGLSSSLVHYLEKRRVEASSVPQKLIEKIGNILETGADAVSHYLNQPAVDTAGASFKSMSRPEEREKKTFADAVREDQQLSDDEKNALLDL